MLDPCSDEYHLFIYDPVSDYARKVLNGTITAGPNIRNACKRHFIDLKNPEIYFDFDAMNRVFKFFEKYLKLSEGQFEGKDFELHLSQKFIVGSLFGWKLKRNGYRRFNRAYIEMGKGNGKSPLAAGIGLYAMLSDNEPGAQIYSAGASRDQSNILFQDAVKMVQASPALSDYVDFSGNTQIYNMYCMRPKQRGSFFRPLARTAGKSGSGPRPHFALIDELHEHPDRSIMELLERGFKFRLQPLLFMITNSGTDRNSVCYEEHDFAVKVASGELDAIRSFSYVCSLDKDDDPLNDESCWIKANPLLDVILTRDYLRDVVKQAKQIPGKENGIKRLHFCIWTDAETAWISREAWEAVEDPNLNIDDFIGRKCYAGLDLGATQDLAAKALAFEDGYVVNEEGEKLPKCVLFLHAYTPRDTLQERVNTDKTPYDVWVNQGFITATPGKIIAYSFIVKDLQDDKEKFDLQIVAYDRWLYSKFEEVAQELNVELPLMEHPQGFNKRRDTALWMPQSVKELENMIIEKRIRVHVNPSLRSGVAGATMDVSSAELKRFVKSKATQRIDTIIAGTMAVGALCLRDEVKEESIYEKLARKKVEREQE